MRATAIKKRRRYRTLRLIDDGGATVECLLSSLHLHASKKGQIYQQKVVSSRTNCREIHGHIADIFAHNFENSTESISKPHVDVLRQWLARRQQRDMSHTPIKMRQKPVRSPFRKGVIADKTAINRPH